MADVILGPGKSNLSMIISGLAVTHTHPFKSAALHLVWHVSVKGGTGDEKSYLRM